MAKSAKRTVRPINHFALRRALLRGDFRKSTSATRSTASVPPDPEAIRRVAEAEAAHRAEATRLAAERAAAEKQARNRAAFKRGMDAERAERNGSVAPASAPDTRAMWRKAIKGENQKQTEAKASTRDKHGIDPRLGNLMPDSPFGP